MNEWMNNSQDGLKHTANFVKMNSHTNIILISVPHWHDLSDWSFVNSDVTAFNRKLVKLLKPYKHVIVVKVDPDKKFFTRQGLHMNNLGKERIALKICNLTLFQKGVQFLGIKLFNHLPPNIKSLSNEINLFKPALKRVLLLHSFYSVEEYLDYSYN